MSSWDEWRLFLSVKETRVSVVFENEKWPEDSLKNKEGDREDDSRDSIHLLVKFFLSPREWINPGKPDPTVIIFIVVIVYVFRSWLHAPTSPSKPRGSFKGFLWCDR